MVEEIQAKSILNPTGGFLATYTHSLNAYQGCAFGRELVPYCYVRAMPVQRFAGRPWGEWVKAKINAPELLKRELEAAKRKGTFGNLRIFMSTATDPYQGAEARLETHSRDSRSVRGERRFRISGRADALAADRTRH